MDKWIADAVGKMHINRITQTDVAAEMEVTNDYVSMILRGVKTPKNAETRVMQAIDNIILKRAEAQKSVN